MPSSNSNYSSHDRRTDSHLNKIEKKVDKVQATLDAHREEERDNGRRITSLENRVAGVENQVVELGKKVGRLDDNMRDGVDRILRRLPK